MTPGAFFAVARSIDPNVIEAAIIVRRGSRGSLATAARITTIDHAIECDSIEAALDALRARVEFREAARRPATVRP